MEFFGTFLPQALVALIVLCSSVGVLHLFKYFEGLTAPECVAVGCALGALGSAVGWYVAS